MAQREAEIRDQMKALKAELREIHVAKSALVAQDDTGAASASTAAPTIKDMARELLAEAPDGATSGQILVAIKAKYGRDVDRTSLSPQLSRLKESGDVVLNGERWFLTALHDAYQQRIMLEVFEQEDEQEARAADKFDDL